MRRRDFGKRERDIGDGKGTKGDHRTQGINDKKLLGTKRGGGDDNGEPRRATTGEGGTAEKKQERRHDGQLQENEQCQARRTKERGLGAGRNNRKDQGDQKHQRGGKEKNKVGDGEHGGRGNRTVLRYGE